MGIRATETKKTYHAIILEAFKLFVSNGYSATSTRQIALNSNIAIGTIYNHFKTKEEIFEAILDSYYPWTYVADAVAVASGSSLEEFVSDAGKHLQAIWRNNPDIAQIHKIESVEFQGKHLPGLFRQLYSELTIIIQEKSKAYQFLSEIPFHRIMRTMLGLFFTYQIANELKDFDFGQEDDDGLFDYFTDIYLHGVLNDIKRD